MEQAVDAAVHVSKLPGTLTPVSVKRERYRADQLERQQHPIDMAAKPDPVRLVVAAALLALGACFLVGVDSPIATFLLVVPPVPDDAPRYSFPADLAGLEAELLVDGRTVTAYRRDDFFGPIISTNWSTHRIDIPVGGRAELVVRVRQDGEVVATDTAAWRLAPNISWWMRVHRGPPLRHDHAFRIWRVPIREDAASYEGETLRLTLFRPEMSECERDGTCVY